MSRPSPALARGAARARGVLAPGRGAALARAAAALLAASLLTGGGCLGKPELEDRWTRVDIESSNVQAFQSLPAGSYQTFDLSTKITYRAIVTGYAVAELRAGTVQPGQVRVAPDAPRERMAYDIDNILANSVSMGRATRAITGWDHLQQGIQFDFAATMPAGVDSSGNPPGTFLLVYLASGEEIRLRNGTDSLVITPFPSGPYEILPVGLPLTVGAPAAP